MTNGIRTTVDEVGFWLGMTRAWWGSTRGTSRNRGGRSRGEGRWPMEGMSIRGCADEEMYRGNIWTKDRLRLSFGKMVWCCGGMVD